MNKQILFTVLLSVFIALLGVGIIIPVMPVLATRLGASGLSLGLIVAAFSLSRGLLQPVVGSLSDSWGRKGFLVTGLFIYALVGLLIPRATSVEDLILIRLFQGVGSAMIVPVGMAYVSMITPEGQEGRYMGYLNIAIFCGIGCGPVLGGLFSDHWGLASGFYAMAGLSFLAFLLVILNMPVGSLVENKKRPGLFASLGCMLKRRKTLGILIARFATMVMMVPTMAFLPLIMSQWQGNSGLQTGLVIASRTIMNAVLQVPFGRLADRSNKVVLLVCGCLCLSLAVFLIPLVTSFPVMVCLYLFLGLGEAVIWPVLGAYASEEAKQHFGHGTMMGVFNLAMSAGVFTGALLAGFSMDAWGMRQAFTVSALAILVLTLGAAGMIGSAVAKEKAG